MQRSRRNPDTHRRGLNALLRTVVFGACSEPSLLSNQCRAPHTPPLRVGILNLPRRVSECRAGGAPFGVWFFKGCGRSQSSAMTVWGGECARRILPGARMKEMRRGSDLIQSV